jgi:hypothetical protein
MTEPAPIEDRTAELERRLAEMESTTNERLVRAELKAEAVRAGMVDLDGLKLIDLTAVTLNDKGEVDSAAALMAQLRKDKPWLFGGGSSSSPAVPPPAQPPAAKKATAMSHKEWQAARADLLRRR